MSGGMAVVVVVEVEEEVEEEVVSRGSGSRVGGARVECKRAWSRAVPGDAGVADRS